MTIAQHVSVVFFFIAAVPALLFPVLYFFLSPWRSTIVGKMMMTKSSSIALIFLLSVVFRYVPDFPLRDWLIAVAYAYLAGALWFQTTVLLRVQRHRQHSDYTREDVGQR